MYKCKKCGKECGICNFMRAFGECMECYRKGHFKNLLGKLSAVKENK